MRLSSLLFTIALAAHGLLATEAKQTEPRFKEADWAVSVIFPGKHKIEKSEIPTVFGPIKQTFAGHVDGTAAFAIMKVEFPIPIPKEHYAAGYDGGRDELLAGTRGKLVSEEKRQVAGADGRKYVILTDNGGRLFEQISVILAGVNYNVSVMADKTTFPRAAADEFFASVQLTPPSR